jgi:diacylglycerol kinase family enzyme
LVVLGKIISGNMPLSVDVEIISTDKATVSTNVAKFQTDGEYCGSETTKH